MRSHPGSFLLACLVILGLAQSVLADRDIRRVLMINSYHRGNPWGDDVERGVRERLAALDADIELSIEYLDTRRFTGEEVLENMAAHLGVKYLRYAPDVLIVSDNAAFDFILDFRRRLFPTVPVVFCGYNDFRPAALSGQTDITGVNEEIDLLANLETALRVHPQTTTLAFILSTAEISSRRIAQNAEDHIFPELRKRFELAVLKDAPLDEIRRKLARLPGNAVLFLAGQTSDLGEGRPLTQVENARLIVPLCPVPVYAFWDFQLGTGVLGGRILSGFEQGRTAGDMAVRILNGTPAGDIPVMMEAPTRQVFDHAVMLRFGIAPEALPEGSEIINRPVTVWTQYRGQIMGILAVIGVQTLLIAALVRAMRQRQRALTALEEERALLEMRVDERTRELQQRRAQLEEALLTRTRLLDNALVVITLVRGRRFEWVSNHVSEMLGFVPEEMLGRSTAFVYYDPDDYRRLWAEAAQVLARGETYQGDFRLRRKDGHPLWCTMSAKALDPADLEKGILFVVADVNARKLMEQALREAKAHLELLSTTDQLTGLANRRRLTDAMGDEIRRAKRYGQPFSIILLDIDHFKHVNDSHGHDAGDYVLRQFAQALAGNLRATDIAGRWGGEEFLIVCPGTDTASARSLAELLRRRIENHDFGPPLRVTASFGVAQYTPDIDSETLMKAADGALYLAKKEGRNRVRSA